MLGVPDILASAKWGLQTDIADLVRRGGRQEMRAIAPNDSVSTLLLKNMPGGRQNVGCAPNYSILAPQKKI